MIDPKSLRIGNYLYRNGLMEVVGLVKDSIKVYDHYNKVPIQHFLPADSFLGIPLSEQELIRLGFESRTENAGNLPCFKKGKLIVARWIENRWQVWIGMTDLFRSPQHVHELQNLFYEIERTELTYKVEN